jgi:hypothetical protein
LIAEKKLYIYDRNIYIEDIRDRYLNTIESFLTVFRDWKWEIRGFADWYIDSFDNIYNNEFLYYYWLEYKKQIKIKIESILKMTIPNKLLVWTSIWLEEKFKSFYFLYEMIKKYFFNISDENKNILWLAESKIWSNTHWIYHSMWAKRLLVNTCIKNKNSNFESDIFIHPNAVIDYRNEFQNSLRLFLKKHSNVMKEVLSVA